MSLQINIPDDDIKHLTEPAKEELVISVNEYVNELINEASRLEAIENIPPEENQKLLVV